MTQQPLTVCGNKNIYSDFNATTPPAQILTEKLAQWLMLWGNPSSIHWTGREPKALLRESRKKVAQLIGATSPLEIVFTSGGSEANNLIIKGVWESLNQSNPQRATEVQRNHYLVGATEHPSVAKAMNHLRKRGAEVEVIPVNRGGEIDLNAFEKQLRPDTALVSMMLANNETGSLYPVKKMAALCKKVGALFHTDAVQALGKIPVTVAAWGVDFATFSGHKFYALKGCGVAYIRQGHSIESLIHGGGQERGRRAGTENLMAIAALAEMAQYQSQIIFQAERLQELRDHLQQQIVQRIDDVMVTGDLVKRLPNTLSLVIARVDGESLLMNLDIKGFSVSTGAACSSGNPEPSPVLMSMGLSRSEAQSSLRVSLGWSTTRSEIDSFVNALVEVVHRLRKINEVTL